MPNVCKKCGNQFKHLVEIDGVKKNLSSRSYCLVCSPFKKRNTRKLNGEIDGRVRDYNCKVCGDTNPTSFNKKKSICKKCKVLKTIECGREIKRRGVELLGGKCKICGYSKHLASLHFHHVGTKDNRYDNRSRWPWDRLKKELEQCILLCANCHAELHAIEKENGDCKLTV